MVYKMFIMYDDDVYATFVLHRCLALAMNDAWIVSERFFGV